jgi:hypothetical protein
VPLEEKKEKKKILISLKVNENEDAVLFPFF